MVVSELVPLQGGEGWGRAFLVFYLFASLVAVAFLHEAVSTARENARRLDSLEARLDRDGEPPDADAE